MGQISHLASIVNVADLLLHSFYPVKASEGQGRMILKLNNLLCGNIKSHLELVGTVWKGMDINH